MQSYKDRIEKNHQRSASFCNYDEFTRRSVGGNFEHAEFRQRKTTQDSNKDVERKAPYQNDSHCDDTNESSPLNTNIETCPASSSSNAATTNGDKRHADSFTNDVTLPLICSLYHYPHYPLTNRFPTSLPNDSLVQIFASSASSSPLSADISNNLESQPTQFNFKGHRRSLSLRQRLEFSVDYIVSEFEHTREVAEKTVIHAKEIVWKVCHYSHLPAWMQDNEFLQFGHRPPLPTLWECAKSVFRVHTETGNIWTHLIGAILFLALMIYEFVTISAHKDAADRLMLAIYFCGIILCLLFSTMFHTFSCYASPSVIKFFSKLDYCGISLQIIGSMIPALYYGFYNDFRMFKIYIGFGVALCILSIIVSMWDKFGEPAYRPFRAIVFLTFGLSNVIPGVHWYIYLDQRLTTPFSLFIFQGLLYVIGSLLYANRIPERFFPGKCDYIFQSHQIFHILVVVAALVHLNGINLMADFVIGQARLQSNMTSFALNSLPASTFSTLVQ